MSGQLASAVFRNTIIDDCRLRSAVLRGAIFDRCHLIQTNIEKADLDAARFIDSELERMEFWGWHGYAGAIIPDDQKFKGFIASDVGPRLREAVASGYIPDRIEAFIEELGTIDFYHGEVILNFEEWSDVITFDDFIAVGKIVTEANNRVPQNKTIHPSPRAADS